MLRAIGSSERSPRGVELKSDALLTRVATLVLDKEADVAKFEIVPVAELKTRLPAKLLPLVEEYKEKLDKLDADQRGRLTLEKGDDAKDLRKAIKAAAGRSTGASGFPSGVRRGR
jgi:hypothetical protein